MASKKKHRGVGGKKRVRKLVAKEFANPFETRKLLSRKSDKAWKDYHAGKIVSHVMNRRMTVLDRLSRAARDQGNRPKYKAGDRVQSHWGEKATISGTSHQDGTSSGGLLYRVVRGEERGETIRDLWPAEVIARKL